MIRPGCFVFSWKKLRTYFFGLDSGGTIPLIR
jgi:hypothetical protein